MPSGTPATSDGLGDRSTGGGAGCDTAAEKFWGGENKAARDMTKWLQICGGSGGGRGGSLVVFFFFFVAGCVGGGGEFLHAALNSDV